MGGYYPLSGVQDYLSQAPAADVGGGGGLDLGSLLGQGGGGLGGLGGLLNIGQGIGDLLKGGAGGDLAGATDIVGALSAFIPGVGPILAAALPALGNLIGPMIQGLPGNVKPQEFANYMMQQGGLAGDLGKLINAAQAASGSQGVLSMSGPGAFNPNFEAGLLEALTGQNLGNDVGGRQTFNAPAAGGAKQGVSMTFNDAANILGQLSMTQGAGYTPAQLSTPKAIAAIMKATKGGMVGTGEGLGAKKVGEYLPAVEKALADVGITPAAGGAGGGGGTTGGGGGGGTTGGGGSTGTPDYGNLNDYIKSLQGEQGGLKVSDLYDLLGKLNLGQNLPSLFQNPNWRQEIGNNPLSQLGNLFNQGGQGGGGDTATATGGTANATAQANPTINNIIQQATQKQAPFERFAMSVNPLSSATPWTTYNIPMPSLGR